MRVLFPCALLALVLLAGCAGSGGSDPAPVARPSAKAELCSLVRTHYLWPETLPPQVDPEAHPNLQKLLNHLTAKARNQGMDRSWSFVQAEKDDSGLPVLYDPQSDSHVGYGMTWVERPGSLQVGAVLPGSGAALAGIRRGDEWLALAGTAAGLDDPANSIPAILSARRFTEALGPATAGTTRYFRLRKGGSGAMADVAVTQSRVSLDLVPQAASPFIIHAGGRKVGYLQLRAFRTPAEDLLRQACRRLRQAGVTDLIVDLRYNGGGSSVTGEVFANLLRADQAPGDVMARIQYNASRPERIVPFKPEPEALRLGRIAFIVTGRSASASEALANVLLPYFHRNVALVGARTSGKPVGMEHFPIPGSGWEMYLVTFQVRNAAGAGGYFRGLPGDGFAGSSCAAEDDLRHAPGDPLEASTAAALRWILHGTSALGPIPPAPAALDGERLRFQAPSLPLPGRDPELPGLI